MASRCAVPDRLNLASCAASIAASVFSVLVSKQNSKPIVVCLSAQLPGFFATRAGWPGSNGSTIGTNLTVPRGLALATVAVLKIAVQVVTAQSVVVARATITVRGVTVLIVV